MSFSAAQSNTSFPATGRFSVEERNDAPRSEWDGWLAGSPGGGQLLQSHEWGELKRRMGWKPMRLALKRDGEVVGVGQFLLYRTTPLTPGYLMYCPKGPWLPWEDDEAVRAFFGGAVAIAARRGVHTLKIEPEVRVEQEGVTALLSELGFREFRWNVNHRTTMVVDLSPSEDKLLANMKKGTRYSVRRAAREGVTVVEDNSPEAIASFWEMHKETVERKDFWSRPYSYYSAVWRAMEDAGRAHLFFAEHEGDRLAAALMYTFGEKCLYMLGTMSREKRQLQPAYLLQWEIMRWAKGRGITHYDMWGIPTPDKLREGHPLYGVYKFKEGFGSEMVSFVGDLDLPVARARAKLWNKVEPTYFRLHQRLKGDVYY